MKKILMMLFLVSILVAGCGSEQETTEQAASSVNVVEQTADTGAKATQAATTAPAGPALTSEIKGIMAKADSVTSLEYSHNGWEKDGVGYNAHLYVKGNKQKHVFGKMRNVGTASYYNTVYVDTSAKTASAYCENNNVCDDPDKEMPVDYGLFVTLTPFDLLNDIKYGAKIGTEIINSRNCVKVQYDKNGWTYTVWLWDYKGVPLRYEVAKGEEKVKRVDYENLQYNNVKDTQLEHQ